MGTIVQEYGPFYGEPVNGTVFGRPNGSVYVPSSNLISINPRSTSLTQYGGIGNLWINAGVDYVAVAQDLASYVQFQVFDDASCTTPTATAYARPAGSFNGTSYTVGGTPGTPVTSGTKYYLRAQLMNNGVAVATSAVVEVEGA